MDENKLPFAKGASIHRPPMFSGINYQFSNIRMKSSLNQLTKVFEMQF